MVPERTRYNYINWEAFLSHMRDKYSDTPRLEEILNDFDELFVSSVETSIDVERGSLLGYMLRELEKDSSGIKETLRLD